MKKGSVQIKEESDMKSGVCKSRKDVLVSLNSLGGVSGGERLAIDVNHRLLSEIE